ncbi:hypothetical protein FUAX_06870 [Fulvitalea axinellae]|uniref:RDD domain-containing protein n=1 Tax=Fulvitalea axinellae TaxID=1182444 RepID=A0AAU9CGB4_9BACT|nr:hypothetical protein FUAX_06870 [Fulvitalea axinellae]
MNTANNLILDDLTQKIEYEEAGKGRRFANSLIDIFCMYIFTFLIGMVIGLVLFITSSKSQGDVLIGEGTDLLIGLLSAFSYFFLFEGLTKGRTMGKLITGTKAVGEEGEPLTWKMAFIRSLVRFVPFEAFSFLGEQGFHDKWSKTEVVRTKRKA